MTKEKRHSLKYEQNGFLFSLHFDLFTEITVSSCMHSRPADTASHTNRGSLSYRTTTWATLSSENLGSSVLWIRTTFYSWWFFFILEVVFRVTAYPWLVDNKTRKYFNKFGHKTLTLCYYYASKTLGGGEYAFFSFSCIVQFTGPSKQGKQELSYSPNTTMNLPCDF